MTQVIVFNQDNGIPAVVMPTEECLQNHTILEIAIKDVPSGKPFKIVDASTRRSSDLINEYSEN
jgi:hypothetical protein